MLEWDSLKIDFTADTTFELRAKTQHFPSLDELDETWNADALESHGDSVLLTPRHCFTTCPTRHGLFGDSSVSLTWQPDTANSPEFVYRLVPSSP